MKYLIGKMSKLYGLSAQAIHHYEKIGLISVRKDESTGYRYFDKFDIQRLGTIRKLRNVSVPLKESVNFFKGHSLEQQYQLFYNQNELIQKEINENVQRSERLQNIMHQFSTVQMKDFYEINEIEKHYYQNSDNNISDLSIEKMESWFNVLIYSNIMYRINRVDQLIEPGFSIIISEKRAIEKNVLYTDEANVINKGRYINKSFIVGSVLLIQKVINFIEEMNEIHEINGMCFFELIHVFTNENNKRQNLIKLYIPIK